MLDISRLTFALPITMRRRIEPLLDALGILTQLHNTRAVTSMLPSMLRGFVIRQGRLDAPTHMLSGHTTYFDWRYPSDFPAMRELYSRAKQNQWDAELALDWGTSVDPDDPDVPLLPSQFLNLDALSRKVKLNAREERRLKHAVTAWMLSQFLHGEQGALFAAAQVTESVQWFDGKLYGATQVMDEGRHVEAFHRYLDEKLNKLYVINDNLFTIIDSLMTDARWDMKFLGMQIMVEGLALGAFGTLYRMTREPLLKNLLRYIIQDEARHVHYGVLALREHFHNHLSDRERREREEWSFEIALMMRNRFMAHEVYEEWFEGILTRNEWNHFISESPGMTEFRHVMFNRLVPNLKYIGLLSPRMQQYYEDAGLMQFATGLNATELSGDRMIDDLDHGASHVTMDDIDALKEVAEHGHDHDDDDAEPIMPREMSRGYVM